MSASVVVHIIFQSTENANIPSSQSKHGILRKYRRIELITWKKGGEQIISMILHFLSPVERARGSPLFIMLEALSQDKTK